MKRIVSVMLVMAMLICVLPVFSAAAANDMVVYNCKEWVSLRATNSTSAPRIVAVPLGATVTDCAKSGDWVYCNYMGNYGYILAKYLKSSSSSSSSSSTSGIYSIENQQVYNCTSWVSLRKTPSTSATRLAQVPKGAVVTNCITNGTWVQCTYGGQTGYILAKYLKNASSSSSSSSTVITSGSLQVYNCYEWVSLRTSASTSAARLTKVPVGAIVTNCAKSGEWVKCTYAGMTGYVLAKYLRTPTSETVPSYTAPDATTFTGTKLVDQQVYNCNYWVSLRYLPDVNTKAVAQVPLGAVVTNCISNGTWVQCTYDGNTGYILAKYLRTPVAAVDFKGVAMADQQVSGSGLVYMYQIPSVSSDIIDSLDKGDVVTDCVSDGTWVECTYNGKTGYILAKNLKNVTAEVVKKISDQTVVNVAEYVYLRKTASDSGIRLEKVPLGETVTDCYVFNGWVYCTYNGVSGYIRETFLAD